MVLRFYKITSDRNVVYKEMTHVHDMALPNIGYSKNEVSKLSFTLLVTPSFDIESCNYAYIDEYKRYYYITEMTRTSGGYRLTLKVDVLTSFPAIVKSANVKLNRKTSGNAYIVDSSRKLQINNVRSVYHFNDGAPIFDKNKYQNLMLTSGGGTIATVNVGEGGNT